MLLSLGILDGRNIWKNDFATSLSHNRTMAAEKLGMRRIMIAPSCSLLHAPCDLDLETNDHALFPDIKNWDGVW